MTFYKRPPPLVLCTCGQKIGDAHVAKGWKRCAWCVEHFAKSSPPRPLASPKAQAGIFDGRAPPPLPPVPVVSDVERANKVARKLAAAREAAAADPHLARLAELRRKGVPLDDAIALIEHEQNQQEKRGA